MQLQVFCYYHTSRWDTNAIRFRQMWILSCLWLVGLPPLPATAAANSTAVPATTLALRPKTFSFQSTNLKPLPLESFVSLQNPFEWIMTEKWHSYFAGDLTLFFLIFNITARIVLIQSFQGYRWERVKYWGTNMLCCYVSLQFGWVSWRKVL